MSDLPSASKSSFQNNTKYLSLLNPRNHVLFWSVETFSILFKFNFPKRKKAEFSRRERNKSPAQLVQKLQKSLNGQKFTPNLAPCFFKAVFEAVGKRALAFKLVETRFFDIFNVDF